MTGFEDSLCPHGRPRSICQPCVADLEHGYLASEIARLRSHRDDLAKERDRETEARIEAMASLREKCKELSRVVADYGRHGSYRGLVKDYHDERRRADEAERVIRDMESPRAPPIVTVKCPGGCGELTLAVGDVHRCASAVIRRTAP